MKSERLSNVVYTTTVKVIPNEKELMKKIIDCDDKTERKRLGSHPLFGRENVL